MTTSPEPVDTVSPSARAAGVQFVALGLGFGVGAAVALAYLAKDGQLPMTPFGFRALEGPLARIGTTETFVFGGALVASELAGIAAGAGLWRGRRWAGRLGLAITPISFALAIGFDLPFLLVGVPLRVATLLRAWPHLR
jgi:hypothetical protein